MLSKQETSKLTHAGKASKRVVLEGPGPLVVEERGWRRRRHIVERLGLKGDEGLGMG